MLIFPELTIEITKFLVEKYMALVYDKNNNARKIILDTEK